jgi:hypothetical protein
MASTRVRRESDLRYYVGVPFARTPDADEREALARLLQRPVIEHSGRTDYTIDTQTVDVTEGFAFVAVEMAPRDQHAPTDVRTRILQLIGEWDQHHGVLGEPLRRGTQAEVGTLAGARLDTVDGRDAIYDRLEAKHAGEHDSAGEQRMRHYIVATPERPLADAEVALIDHVAEQPVDVDAGYAALPDAAPPLVSYRSHDSNDFANLLMRLESHPRVDDSADLVDRHFWQTRTVGTLPDDVDEETLRTAVRQRALAQSPHAELGDTDGAAGADLEVDA